MIAQKTLSHTSKLRFLHILIVLVMLAGSRNLTALTQASEPQFQNGAASPLQAMQQPAVVPAQRSITPGPGRLVLQPGPGDGMDTHIDQDDPDTAYGDASSCRIGNRSSDPSFPGGPYRSLLQFDLAQIPAWATVVSATLEVYVNNYEGSNTFQLYRATSAWDEAVTWNTQPSYDESAMWGSFSSTEGRQYVKRAVDITEIISRWHNGTYDNFGFYIKGSTESAWTRQHFYASNGSEEAYRPKLVIDFAPPENPIILQPGPGEGMDTYVDYDNPDTAYGDSSSARIGNRSSDPNYPGGPYRSLLRFDLFHIPTGVNVLTATLEVYVNNYEGSNTFRLYRATSVWDEDTTWNTQPSYDESEMWGSFSSTQGRQYVKRTVDITEIVSRWRDDTYDNFGFYIRGSTENAWTRQHFYTSDGDNVEYRPKLVIDYEIPVYQIFLPLVIRAGG